MGNNLRVLRDIFSINTTMPGFRWFSKNRCVHVLWPKVTLALEGLIPQKLSNTLAIFEGVTTLRVSS